MYVFSGQSADNAWNECLHQIMKNGSILDSRAGLTKEIIHAIINITNPNNRIIYSRRINLAFGYAELLWILQGMDDLKFIQFWNPRMHKFSDDGVKLHGAYGKRIADTFGFNQLLKIYETLRSKPNTRQTVMQIWNSSIDFPTDESTYKDIPSSLFSQIILRDNRLHFLHSMRSNDLFWGTPYDILIFTTIQEIVAGWLNVELGDYTHVVGSLHIYKRHWKEANSLLNTASNIHPQKSTFNKLNHNDFYIILSDIWNIINKLMNETSTQNIISEVNSEFINSLPISYRDIMIIMITDILCKKGDVNTGFNISNYISDETSRYTTQRWVNKYYEK